MVLKYEMSPYPSLAEDIIVNVYEASDDTAVVDTQTFHPPFNTPTLVTFNGLDKVVHVVRAFTQSGTKLHEYNAEPKSDLVTIFDPIRFIIGDGGFYTPAANSGTYENPILAGLAEDDYIVFRNNYGALHPNVHYSIITDPLLVPGFNLAAPDTFNDKEEFTITMNPKTVTTTVNDSVVGKWFAGIVDVFGNLDYDKAHLRKLLRLNGAVTYNLTGSIPIGYGFLFENCTATVGDATINFVNAQLRLGDDLVDNITLPHMTTACFVYNGTIWDVVYICDARWVKAASPNQPGTIVKADLFHVGNIPVGDPVYDVVHNMNISGDYMVQLSLMGTDVTKIWDNDVIAVWYHHPTDKKNTFKICLQEKAAGVQDLTIAWVIIKL